MPEKKENGHAVVDVAGKQFRVAMGQEIMVPHTVGEAGHRMRLERVLLLNDGKNTHFGNPTVTGASVEATLLRHGRDRKITVFKMRRRKGYRKKTGHRQGYSILRIDSINLTAGKSSADASKKTGSTAPATDSPGAEQQTRPESKAKAAPEKATTAKKTSASTKPATSQKSKASKTTVALKNTSPAKKPTGTTKEAATKTATEKKTGSD
ncbi:50S ribosomal protein L21 [Candidatus Neomarinimicrobiota bacterium]